MTDTRKTNDYGLTYDEWYAAVDAYILRAAGVSASDLADAAFRDGWEDGADPDEFAADMLEDEGWG